MAACRAGALFRSRPRFGEVRNVELVHEGVLIEREEVELLGLPAEVLGVERVEAVLAVHELDHAPFAVLRPAPTRRVRYQLLVQRLVGAHRSHVCVVASRACSAAHFSAASMPCFEAPRISAARSASAESFKTMTARPHVNAVLICKKCVKRRPREVRRHAALFAPYSSYEAVGARPELRLVQHAL
jgi:hypothetical protein